MFVNNVLIKDEGNKCCECSDPNENYICLKCEKIFCSRYMNGHMSDHNSKENHSIVLSLADFSFYCYNCIFFINF
jgi:uncharacterized UBP type Zn finger protein